MALVTMYFAGEYLSMLALMGFTVAAGMLLIWGRALWVAAPVLAQPVVTEFSALVERVEPRPAKAQVRILARPRERADLPPRIRLTLRTASVPGCWVCIGSLIVCLPVPAAGTAAAGAGCAGRRAGRRCPA